MTDILPSLDEIDLALAERSLKEFVVQAWPTVEPVAPFIPGWHIDAICDHLEAMARGDILNLVINVPPGHSKSLLTSVLWLPWWWIREPHIRSLHATYAGDLSARDSRRTLSLLKSEWYTRRWGNRFGLAKETEARIENTLGGTRLASSVGGQGTGERAHVSVSDDLLRANDAQSPAMRAQAIEHLRAMASRGVAGYPYRQLLIMQRLHEDDPAGWALSQDLGFEHLCLPAEYEPSRKCVTSIGFSDPRQTEGELLWPEVVNEKQLADLRKALGPYGYAGQCQQRPAPAGGGRFKQDWFRTYESDGEHYKLWQPGGSFKVAKVSECDRFAMMDPAGSEKTQNNKPCYTVIQVWDVTPDHDMVLVDQYRGQVEAPSAADKGVELCRQFDAPWIGVEKDGIGLGVVQTIRRRGVTVRPIKARGSKEARSETAEIRMAAGMVYWPKGAPWKFDFEAELLGFPNGEYKDQVDTLAHAAIWVQKSRGAPLADDELDEQAETDVADPPRYQDTIEAATPADDDTDYAFAAYGDD